MDPQPGTLHANFASYLRRRWDALAVCPVGTFTLGIEWVTPRRFVVNHWERYHYGVGVIEGASKTDLLRKLGVVDPPWIPPKNKSLQLLSPPQLPAFPFSNPNDAEKKS